MDKKSLQAFSVWAKQNLENQIEVSLKTLGIYSDSNIKNAKRVGDYTVIEGDSNSYPSALFEKRKSMIALIKQEGYKQIIEEFAYTWFNRFVALRYMEVHGFLPHGFRVLSSRDGSFEPEIIKNLNLIQIDLKLDIALCQTLKAQGKIEELYKHVLFQQCNALSNILPMLFSTQSDYLELLLPKNLLKGETVLTKLLEIEESNFLSDVEIIGWLYQFYVSSDREKFRKASLITKSLIPTLTQIFTPDWIVRYMAENSVGRLWLESYPNSALKSQLNYYVEDAEQTPEVQQKMNAIKYSNVSPEQIKIMEPCAGSGHILVYVFDLLYKMYEEKGYQKRDIPSLILKHNLYGLEIDKRASQLASFSLVMKARSLNNKFFSEQYYVEPQVYEIWDSRLLHKLGYKKQLEELKLFSGNEMEDIEYLVETFTHAKTIGSLLRVEQRDWNAVEQSLQKLSQSAVMNIFNHDLLNEGMLVLQKLLQQARVFSYQYDVMITNPPYLGISKMEDAVKNYANAFYPNSKSDMFAMFMETNFVKQNGFNALVNPDSWMFLVSYEKMRKELLNKKSIVNMIHLGMGAFDAVVQTTSFVIRNSKVFGYYYETKEISEANKIKNEGFVRNIDNYLKVPLNRFMFWISQPILNAFKCENLKKIANTKAGMVTGNSERFLRFWWESDLMKIGFRSKRLKWIPYQKGGNFRKWYGNNEYIVNWENDGYSMKNDNFINNRIKSHNYNSDWGFRRALTWTEFSSGNFSCRKVGEGYLFDSSGPMCFVYNENNEYNILALFNSKVANFYFNLFNPTVHYLPSNLLELPFIDDRLLLQDIKNISMDNVENSIYDWDSFENSWDFSGHPLIPRILQSNVTIQTMFDVWQAECQNRFETLKANEEELNRIFIDIYGLQEELTPEVEDKDVTVRLADKSRDIKALVSYLVGVAFGRYSLDTQGLAFAGGEWDDSKYQTYKPDSDGIIPVFVSLGMEDSLTARLVKLLKLVYGESTYRQNIDFVAETLGKKQSETSEETLNRYLCEEFFTDHVRYYQKRPIYWMFSSGKNKAFQCLIYMHRYSQNTLARMNAKYFLPESTRLKNEMEELRFGANSAEGKERLKQEKQYALTSTNYLEMIEYGQVLDHIANKYITIDLDDGVKVNYEAFQNIELVSDSGARLRKNLLEPIK